MDIYRRNTDDRIFQTYEKVGEINAQTKIKKQSEEDKADIYAFRNNEAELTEVLQKEEAQKKEEEMPEEYVITDFPIIDQMTESSVERQQL